MAVVLAGRRGLIRAPIGRGPGRRGHLDRRPRADPRASPSVWYDSETLWRYAIEVDPGCALSITISGSFSVGAGIGPRPRPCSSRAIALRPDRSEFQGNYGPPPDPDGPPRGWLAKLRYRLERNRGTSTRGSILGSPSSRTATPPKRRRAEAGPPRQAGLGARLNSLGRALLADGRAEPARAAFERVLAIDAADPLAHLGLARAHLARGDRAAAREQIPCWIGSTRRLPAVLEQEIR